MHDVLQASPEGRNDAQRLARRRGTGPSGSTLVDREHTAVVGEHQDDLALVARPVRPWVKSTNRGFGVDVMTEHGVSERVADVSILDPLPSGTDVDASFTPWMMSCYRVFGPRGRSHGAGDMRRVDLQGALRHS